MKNSSLIEIAIQLVEHPKFEWKEGMKTACGTVVKKWHINKWLKSFDKDESPVPDLKDPGTKGWLLHAVREVCGDKDAYVCRFEQGWCIQIWPEPNIINHYEDEGEALAMYLIGQSKYI